MRVGCPSYYKESDYKFYLAVECLEKAAATSDIEERESLARDAFTNLSSVPESVDLQTVCKRFEDLRFVESDRLLQFFVILFVVGYSFLSLNMLS